LAQQQAAGSCRAFSFVDSLTGVGSPGRIHCFWAYHSQANPSSLLFSRLVSLPTQHSRNLKKKKKTQHSRASERCGLGWGRFLEKIFPTKQNDTVPGETAYPPDLDGWIAVSDCPRFGFSFSGQPASQTRFLFLGFLLFANANEPLWLLGLAREIGILQPYQ